MQIPLEDRYIGSLLGLACGDAVGTSVEFCARGSFPPVTDMLGGGPFSLPAGHWTDDTSMALCLAESLCTQGGFNARDQMGRYSNWWQWGYFSSTGDCFDIGMTTRDAIMRFMKTGDPYAGSNEPDTAGNGSLMRLAPIALFFHPNKNDVIHFSGESSRTTHAAPEAIACCKLLGLTISKALSGCLKEQVLEMLDQSFNEPKVAEIAAGIYKDKKRSEVFGSGYSVASLEAALWCFHTTSDFESAVLTAANLGDDADTTAAIVGQIAGAFYGASSIPKSWKDKLCMGSEISGFAKSLYIHAKNRASNL